MEKPRTRATRRAATHRIIERRARDARGMALCNSDHSPFEPGRLAKDSYLRCDCRKRRKGAPRRSRGICELGARASIYADRASNRALGVLARRGDLSDESLDLVLRRFEQPRTW